ncbi:hypothetical protein LJC21_02015 [Bacteroides sp. OttesenSCG-928-E20]|nr:hypothetical protein [Bacteroides sp. OttesenSCG-928-E20]MDL2305685.1 hypothetical protein [Bacteroides sp. OttesenSCG-928-D19]
MKRITLVPLLFLFLIQPFKLHAQEFFVNADLVSSFIWRGLKCGDICLQPSMGVNIGKFSFMAWGSTDLKTYDTHADLFLSYQHKGFKIQVADYFVQPSDETFNYFHLKARTTNHMTEAIVSYKLSEKLPLTLLWSSFFAGSDYNNADGGRSYSSYLQASYPFSTLGFDFNAEIGMTPWEGMYSDGLNVVNIGLSMAKKIKITEKFSLPVSCKLVVNPSSEQTYVVFGLSL